MTSGEDHDAFVSLDRLEKRTEEELDDLPQFLAKTFLEPEERST